MTIQDFGPVCCLVHTPALTPTTLTSRPLRIVGGDDMSLVSHIHMPMVFRDKELQIE